MPKADIRSVWKLIARSTLDGAIGRDRASSKISIAALDEARPDECADSPRASLGLMEYEFKAGAAGVCL